MKQNLYPLSCGVQREYVQRLKSLKAVFKPSFSFCQLAMGLSNLAVPQVTASGLPWCVSCISLYQLQVNWSNLIVPFCYATCFFSAWFD